jgi:YqaJ-like recombinase protein
MDQIEQNTPEWHAARCGKLTASRIADATARLKSDKNSWGASRAVYMGEKIIERLSGKPYVGYRSRAMDLGAERQPNALARYELYADIDVEPVGFVPHPKIKDAGASPDGFVGRQGLVEFKCPQVNTHIETLRTKSISGNYVKQMQFQMACTGRRWCDFVSWYEPDDADSADLPEPMKCFIKRVHRDDALIAELERDAVEFLRELEQTVATLRSEYMLMDVLKESAA